MDKMRVLLVCVRNVPCQDRRAVNLQEICDPSLAHLWRSSGSEHDRTPVKMLEWGLVRMQKLWNIH
jgi:hypothetical protein